MAESTIFTKIINREIPSAIRYEDDDYIVINDIHPQAKLHVLIIPKQEIATLEDMSPEQLGSLFQTVFKVVEHLGLSNIGYRLVINVKPPYQEVPHVHVHLISNHLEKNTV